MPQVEQLKSVHPARRWVLVVVVVAVLALGAGVAAWLILAGPSVSSMLKQADAEDEQGKFNQAYFDLKKAYNHAYITSDKVAVLSRLAPVSVSLDKKEEALGYYQQLNKLQPNNIGTLMGLGGVAVDLGHKDVALAAYRQAVTLLKSKPKGPRTEADIAGLNTLIDQLGHQ